MNRRNTFAVALVSCILFPTSVSTTLPKEWIQKEIGKGMEKIIHLLLEHPDRSFGGEMLDRLYQGTLLIYLDGSGREGNLVTFLIETIDGKKIPALAIESGLFFGGEYSDPSLQGVLMHEGVHVEQFERGKFSADPRQLFESEIEAYTRECAFMHTLNLSHLSPVCRGSSGANTSTMRLQITAHLCIFDPEECDEFKVFARMPPQKTSSRVTMLTTAPLE